MMHEREKSDPAIVAVKPTNKAEQSAAEPVEPRAEAEGNASQHSMDRARNRATVSQALERIRQAARQRKKEKFTTLLHHVSTATVARWTILSSRAATASGRCRPSGLGM